MPTDDERREVAARLRDIGEKICYTSRDVLRAIQDACGCNVGLDWEDMEELRDRLADLIEPKRTCKNLATRKDGFACSVCECEVVGCMIDDFGSWDNPLLFSYCPNCGAKVAN